MISTHIQNDPAIGHRFVSNLKLRVPSPEGGGYRVRTNAAGFRSDIEFEPAKGRAPRVLLFGDSFTAGDGVSNGRRYSDLLASELPAEIYNYGLPGSGTDQQYLIWHHYARPVEHDAVVIAVLVENIRRITSAYRVWADSKGQPVFVAKPYYELHDGKLVRFHDPVPTEPLSAEAMTAESAVDSGGRFPMLRRMIRSAGLQETVQRLTRYQPTPDYDSQDTPGWQLMRAILLHWRSELSRPVVLMPLPLYQHVEGTADPAPYRQRFREVAADGGFILHDPLDDLMTYSAADRRAFRFKTDPHLTEAGHAAIAASLKKTLAQVISG